MKKFENTKSCKCGFEAVPIACDFLAKGKPDFIWQCKRCGLIQDKGGYRTTAEKEND